MRFGISRLRKAGVAALVALTGSVGLTTLVAQPAHAAPLSGITLTDVSIPPDPQIVAGGTNQAAGNWLLHFATWNVAETYAIKVDDSGGAPGNCDVASTTDNFGFAGTPTLTASADTSAGGTTVPSVTVAMSASDAPAGPCAVNGVNNVMTITFHNADGGGGPAQVVISGIKYNPGSANAPGDISRMQSIDGALFGAVAAPLGTCPPDTNAGCSVPIGDGDNANAEVVNVVATANNPATLLNPSTGNNSISNFVLTESAPGAIGPAPVFVCFQLLPTGPGAPFSTFTAGSTPAVAAAGGGAVATTPAVLSSSGGAGAPLDRLSFKVTTASAVSPATYTVSGIKLDTSTATGPVTVVVGQGGSVAAACAAANIVASHPTIFGATGNLVITTIISVTRFAGADRYGTAAAIYTAKQAVDGCVAAGPNPVVLTRGDLFPDALASAYLAGGFGDEGTGILLTNTAFLPAITLSALKDNGVTDVFIAGGPVAVSTAVENQLKATPAYTCGGGSQRIGADGNPVFLKVTRIGGANRYETAELVAEYKGSGTVGKADYDGDTIANANPTAVIATGENFPDALSAGPMAFAGQQFFWFFISGTPANGAVADGAGFPILLTTGSSLSPQAAAGLLNLGIKQVIIMGGTAAVSDTVKSSIEALGITTTRLAGADRTETATKAAAFETATWADVTPFCAPTSAVPTPCTKPAGLGYSPFHANLARGDDFADALVGGPHAGGGTDEGASILLASSPASLGSSTSAYLTANSVKNTTNWLGIGISSLDIFGGPVAITPATASAAQAALTS